TELNHAQTEFNEVAKEMKRLPFDETSNKLKDVGDKLSKLSGAATAVGGASVVAFTQSSDALGKIKSSLGMTTEEADKTLDAVRNLATDGFNFDDALSVMIKVKQSMSDLLDDKQLDKFSGDVLAISKQIDKDFNDVIKTSSSLMKNFKISSEEALDIIVYGIQNGLDISDDFLDTLWEYSNQFADLGFTAKDALEIIAKGMEEGTFNTDKLADMIKEANIRMKEMSDDQKDAINKLGLDVESVQKNITTGGEAAANQMVEVAQKVLEINDPIEQSAIGVELFGKILCRIKIVQNR
ncbi:phage tail tape measure protein, partial [Lactobacillus hominis]|uniref:phage tail tape measure protein n=1 Tax=Lactobacillus hominis TaxID=1203033 RepID=UPI00263A5489